MHAHEFHAWTEPIDSVRKRLFPCCGELFRMYKPYMYNIC